ESTTALPWLGSVSPPAETHAPRFDYNAVQKSNRLLCAWDLPLLYLAQWQTGPPLQSRPPSRAPSDCRDRNTKCPLLLLPTAGTSEQPALPEDDAGSKTR